MKLGLGNSLKHYGPSLYNTFRMSRKAKAS